MTQQWRRAVLGVVLLTMTLGDGVLAHGANRRESRDDKGRHQHGDRDRGDARSREPQLRIADYRLVKVERIERRVWQFTYRARLRNRGPAVAGASAVLLERRPDIDVVDGDLTFGPVDARGVARSADTFSFRRRGAYAHLGYLGDGVRWEIRPVAGNRPPVAHAGSDQSRSVGARVALDGSRSSDPDGDPLSYRWTLRARPAASRAALADADSVRPGFVVDIPGTYVADLVVDDGRASSVEDSVIVTTPNQAPAANAGPDDTVALRERAVLNGAASADADGDALTYRWRLASRPAGSNAALEGATGVSSALTPDVPGSYLVQLTVNDGRVDSAVDSVVVSTRNSAPVARAGADQSAPVRSTVRLDGGASSDADGNPLIFAWTVVSRPAGSVAAPANPAAVNPSIVIDRPGAYRLRLVVSDGTATSAPDDLDISTVNSAPVANAGPDAHAVVGQDVNLDGSGSSDVDGDPLTYSWSLASIPLGSTAALDVAGSVGPRFRLDRPGTYVAQLIVFDGRVSSVADTVVVTTRNSAPIARAGADRAAVAGAPVPLDGTASSDPDGTPVTFAWSFVSVPSGSRTALVNPTTPMPTFRADRDGLYVVQLVVGDGLLSSDPDTVSVSTTNTTPVARAGADVSDVPVDGPVSLDGTASSDADGQSLTFRWSLLSVPAGSAAALSDAGVATPSFVTDRPGDYVAQLIVSDGLRDSAPDTVLIRTANRAPVAAAGPDQTVASGSTVTLDATASSDPDGQILSFEWAFLGVPAGSAATIVDASSAEAAFAVDVAGDFIVRVTVRDGAGGTASADVTVHATAPGTLSAPATLAWPALQVGGSASRTLVVTNIGGGPVSVDSTEATGDFMVEEPASSCLAAPVAAGGTCELRVTFAPVAAGARTASLAVFSDAANSPITVALSGDARAANVTVAPPTLVFAATQIGQSSGVSSSVVTNTGLGDVEIAGVLVSGDFTLATTGSDRCQNGAILPPAATCSIAAAFRPTAAGTRSGSVALDLHGVGDGTIVSRAIALQGDGVALPAVSLTVTDGSAAEASSDPGVVTLSRTGSTASALTVQYTVTGSAINGVDFTLLAGSVTFAAGQRSTVVTVTPVADSLTEAAENVTMTLIDGAGYDLAAPISGTVTIADMPLPTVSVAVLDDTASEDGGQGLFRFTRTGDVRLPLSITLSRGGTATNSLDYVSIATTLVFAAGQATVDRVLLPVNDVSIEGPETAILTIMDGADYDLGAPASGVVTIQDQPTPIITVVALDPVASETGPDTGRFRFTRAGDTALVLTVNFARSGSASSGDYVTAALGASVTFAAGQATVDKVVTPTPDAAVEGSETVVVTLTDGPQYDLGSAVTATVTITD